MQLIKIIFMYMKRTINNLQYFKLRKIQIVWLKIELLIKLINIRIKITDIQQKSVLRL